MGVHDRKKNKPEKNNVHWTDTMLNMEKPYCSQLRGACVLIKIAWDVDFTVGSDSFLKSVFPRTKNQHKTQECRMIDLTARPASCRSLGPSLVTRCIPKTIQTLTNVTAVRTVTERKSHVYIAVSAGKSIVKEF